MFELPKREVLVKPVIFGGWLPKNHSGAWLNDGAVMKITVPISRDTGQLVNPLTREEQEFFEDRSRSGMDFGPGDLSPYRRPDYKNEKIPFWYEHEFTIRKPETIVTQDTVLARLNLSDPMDYLNYKLLLANAGDGGIVASEWDNRYDSATHKLVLVGADEENTSKAVVASDRIRAYKHFDKLQKSQVKMYEFLSVYWLEYPNSTRPDQNSKIPFLIGQIEDIITNHIDRFLKVIEGDYEHKLIIHNGIRVGAIRLIGSTFVLMPDDTPIGSSLQEVILYFKDEKHQEDKLKLMAQIGAEK